jgi:antitoxin component of MazEF toxin-antitoxin module
MGKMMTHKQINIRAKPDGKPLLAPSPNRRYSLTELLAQCDSGTPIPEFIKEWDLLLPVGKELG